MRKPLPPVSAVIRRDAQAHRTHHRGAQAVGAALLLALCHHGRSVDAQQAAMPAASPRAQTSALPAGSAPDQVDDGGDSFDFTKELSQGSEPISADQAADLAVKTGPTVAKAQAAAEQARKAASQAWVAVYPRLDLLAQYTRLSPPPPLNFQFTTTNPATGASMTQNIAVTPGLLSQYLFEARISYPVSDVFLKILPRYRAAQETTKARLMSATAEAQTIGLHAREAYYNYARARATLLVQRAALAQTQAQLHDVESLVHAGTQARVEQMRAEAQVASARVALARAEGAVAVARTALRSLLHREGDQEIAIDEDFSQTLSPLAEDKQRLLAVAMQNRSELRALETMTGVHAKNIQAANADKLPKLSVAANGDFADPNPRATSFENKFRGTWVVIGALTWSPNDFATGDASAAQVEAQRAQTLADMAALEDALRNEVSQAYEDYKAAHQAMEAALTGIRAAEESYRVRREQFRAGAAVATDVIIAVSDLNRARLDLVNASIDLRIARARLDRAVERNKLG